MRCDEVQMQLAERLAKRLADRLSNRLSDTVQASVRAHVLSCADCCNELDDFAEMKSLLDIIPIEPCDSAAMRARFAATHQPPDPGRFLPPAPARWPHSRLQWISLVTGLIAIIVAALFAGRFSGKRSVLHNEPAETHTAAAAAGASMSRNLVAEIPGTLTGRVRGADGTPAPGVRVAVMAVPASGAAFAMDLARLEQTDGDGRYRLAAIPPGRYYVIAGSMDVPTYFPGTPEISGATIVAVKAGAVVEGIDFPRFVPALTVHQANRGAGRPVEPPTAGSGVTSTPDLISVSVTLLLDTGERLPDLPGTSIVFSGVSGSISVRAAPEAGNLFHALLPGHENYAVAVSNIADGYAVLSISSGAMDLTPDGRFTPSESAADPSSVLVTLTRKGPS